jgi:hypothetical protein
MQYLTIVDSPARSMAEHAQVLAELGHEPQGLVTRYVGVHDGHVRIVAVWDSRDAAQQFFVHELGPALARALGPEPSGPPRAQGLDVERAYLRSAQGAVA